MTPGSGDSRRSLLPRCRVGLLLGLALLLPRAPVALATSWPSTHLDTLRAHASLVLRVRVTESESRWLADEGPSRIVTFYALESLERLWGAYSESERGGAHVVLGVPGGEVGDYGQRVHGAPTFAPGDELVVFLGPAGGPAGARGLVGLGHGAFLVRRVPGQVLLWPSLQVPGPPGAMLTPPVGQTPPGPEIAPGADTALMSLEALRRGLASAGALP